LHTTRILLLAVTFALPGVARAEATLFIYPTLVLFENNQRSAEITIANRGDQTGTFETSWTDLTMAPEGGLVKAEGEAPWSVQPHVRYSPRRVTLAPGESQVIKIAVRSNPEIAEGEYYSHLRVLTINSEDPLADDAIVEASEPSPGVSIQARTAVAIPVIWRNSRDTPSMSIEAVRTDADANTISIDVRRHGQLSVRGYLHLLETAADRSLRPLADVVPVVIYPSLDTRTISVELYDGVTVDSLPEGAGVYYSADSVLTERSVVLAHSSIVP
jgi:P pilus assembly chaperone PapD